MSNQISQKHTWERHIQTGLLTLIVLGVGIVGNQLSTVNQKQDEFSVQATALSVQTANLSERIQTLATDRYTATQAAQANLQINTRISEISNTQTEIKARLRDVEQEIARIADDG